MTQREQESGTGTGQKVAVIKALVMRACPHCRAPGSWQSPRNAHEANALMAWPATWVEPTDPRSGKPVGDICPQCAGDRTGYTEDHGVIARFAHSLFDMFHINRPKGGDV